MRFIFTFLGCFFSVWLTAQTVIWQEDFSTYANGTTTGTAGKWTSSCPGCAANDFFEVQNGAFTGNDVNDFATWESQPIDISAYATVEFSLDAIENGDHEGPGCSCGVNVDFFDVYYSTDNGATFTIIEDWNGDGIPGHTLTGDTQNGTFTDADWGSTTITQNGLSGTFLIIRVVIRNTAGSEELTLDNVSVSTNVILPVELLSFEGEQNKNINLLQWSTASEFNNDYFEIQKSTNGGISYETIGQIASLHNTTTSTSHYLFEDNEMNTDMSYYRLKQVDLDGSFTYSNIISLAGRELPTATIYPNPFDTELYVELPTASAVTLLSINGSILHQQQLPAGRNNLALDFATIPAGIYLLQTTTDYGTTTQKIRKF